MNISGIVSNVGNSISKGAGKALDKASNSKFVSNQLANAKQDPAKFVASMALLSLVSKDFINCAVYTYKSWNNKKLENPRFMALMDLVQGVLNVSLQMLVGKAIIEKKLTPTLQSKYTGTVKTSNIVDSIEKSKAAKKAEKLGMTDVSENLKGICNKLRANKEIDNIKDVKADIKPLNAKRVGENINKVIGEMDSKLNIKFDKNSAEKLTESAQKFVQKQCKDPFVKGLGLIVTILGTTALLKRTLIPFISTPVADVMDRAMKASEAKKAQKTQQVA